MRYLRLAFTRWVLMNERSDGRLSRSVLWGYLLVGFPRATRCRQVCSRPTFTVGGQAQ